MTPAPTFRGVLAEAARLGAARWRTLLVVGLIVFVPLGALEAFDARLQEPLGEADADWGLVLAAVAAAFGTAGLSLLGEVVYAGVIAASVEGHADPSLRRLPGVLRHLPLGTLVVIDIAWVALVALGFLLLIVPGFVFLTWFALVAQAAEIEGLGVIAAFRRSHELVRGRFWLSFWLVVPVLVAGGLLAELAQSASLWSLGEGWLADWIAAVIANLISSPLYALVALVLFLRLREQPGD